jgi:protein phosphatase PTC7
VKAVPYQYRIKILTGNRRGAGTEAQVFASIVGTLGDTGERKLEPYMAVGDGGSIVSTTPFERNTWSEFELSVPGGLGEVKQVRIGHRDVDEGWYVSRVEVKHVAPIDRDSPPVRSTFHVHKWLGESESGGVSGPTYITCELNDGVSTNAKPLPPGRSLRLRGGGMALPHPEKVNRGVRGLVTRSLGHAGEDAFMMTGQEPGTGPPYVLGVADGVRQWSEKGIDAGEWSRSLLQEAWDDIHRSWQATQSLSLQEILETAFAKNLSKNILGSSTLCLVDLRPDGKLSSLNLGDSGYILFRPVSNTVMYRSGQQEKSFGCPFQLGHHANRYDTSNVLSLFLVVPKT